jgi:hypothetical protein
MGSPHPSNDREFARIPVRIPARFKILSAEEIETLRETILDAPSVWALDGESTLRNLAASTQAGAEGILARAMLELSTQMARLTYRVLHSGGPMEPATLVQLSGGGARIECHPLLERGTRLQLRLEDHESGNPPVQVLAQVVHAEGSSPGRYGIKFETVHPADQERLIRFIYRLQRKELRRKHMESD